MEGPVMKELKAGLPLLQKPYTGDTAHLVYGHLLTASQKGEQTAANPDPKELKYWKRQGSGAFNLRMLKLVDQYVEWLLPAFLPLPEECTMAATTSPSISASSGIKMGTNSGSNAITTTAAISSSSTTTGGAQGSTIPPVCSLPYSNGDQQVQGPIHMVCMMECLLHYSGQLLGSALGGEPELAALRPHLVIPDSGTLSLLIRTAEAVLAAPPHNRSAQLADTLSNCWLTAVSLFNPSGSSSISGFRKAWSQAPQLRRSLPAMAALKHWHLQQPDLGSSSSQTSDVIKAGKVRGGLLASLVLQVQLLVEGAASAATAAAAGKHQVASSDTGPQQQEQRQNRKKLRQEGKQSQQGSKQPQQQQQQQQQGEAGAGGAPAWQQAWEAQLPATAREQVKGFLWDALGTAAASMLRAGKKKASRAANTSSSTSSQSTAGTTTNAAGGHSSSSTTTATGSSSSRGSRRPAWAPKGAGYRALRLTTDQAHNLCTQAAAALLQLAAADVPQQQQYALASADAWMKQQHRDLLSMGGLVTPAKDLSASMGVEAEALEGGMQEDADISMSSPSSGGASSTSGSSLKGSQAGQQNSSGQKEVPEPPTLKNSLDAAFPLDMQIMSLQRLLEAGCLCWPHSSNLYTSQESSSGQPVCSSSSNSSINSSSSSSNSSSANGTTSTSSCSAAPCGLPSHSCQVTAASSSVTPDTPANAAVPGDNTARLQALTAAVVAAWPKMQLVPASGSFEAMSEALTAVFQLMQQLMLLTLQLQGAPPEQRAAFSRSPAGTILLHVLRGVSLPLMEQRCGLALMVQDVASVAAAAAAAAGGQQVSSAAAGWQICVPNGRDLVELLLLPGLLLAPMSMSAACAPPTPTSSPGLVLNVEKMYAPLVLVPHAAMQLPPGCVPPPAAFFLVEQLLRERPSAAMLSLAIKMLRGSLAVVAADHHHHQQQQREQQQQQKEEGGEKQQQEASALPSTASASGGAELAQLAYCSLAASVVQVVVHVQGLLQPGQGSELLELACELAQAGFTHMGSYTCGGFITSSERSGHEIRQGQGAGVGAASTTTTTSTGSSSGGGGGDSRGSERATWGLAASLAAAVAAGACTAHLPPEVAGAAGQAQQLQGRAPAGGQLDAKDRGQEAAATGNTSVCSSRSASISPGDGGSGSTAEAGGCTAVSDEPVGPGTCPEDCSICRSASQLVSILCCLDHGVIPRISQAAAEASRAVLMRTSQQHGETLQDHLQQLLVAVAVQHPVPGVCSNVLCGRVQGLSSMGAVRGCVGTLCGGCRAAWYCCEVCQKAAWPMHRVVCRAAGSKIG